ncbi:MAG: ATP phosphoribosyltransferase regulatory subunit [Caulobacteraceae bacterium]|nr:ATP phosphoribosyltransferase regulatory subunit [Caulobacteraceae bacterium]
MARSATGTADPAPRRAGRRRPQDRRGRVVRAEPKPPEPVLAAIRAPFLEAGGEPVDPPILQPLGVLLELAGEALRERLFVVQAEGGEEACLRPDFTIPLARTHLQRGAESGRYVYEGRAFRAAGGDGYEEFRQLGLEVHQADDAAPEDADVEIAALAWRAAAAGGRDALTLALGDAGLFAAFVGGLGLDAATTRRLSRLAARPRLLRAELERTDDDAPAEPNRLAALLAQAPEGQAAQVLEEVWALAGIEPVGGRTAAEIAHRLAQRAERDRQGRLPADKAAAIAAYLTIDGELPGVLDRIAGLPSASPALSQRLDGWRARGARLAAAGVPAGRLRFTTAAGRSFDYYDGARFEILSAALGPTRPVAAGGRYDGLLARLGGELNAAVGCMIRPWRAYAGGQA